MEKTIVSRRDICKDSQKKNVHQNCIADGKLHKETTAKNHKTLSTRLRVFFNTKNPDEQCRQDKIHKVKGKWVMSLNYFANIYCVAQYMLDDT